MDVQVLTVSSKGQISLPINIRKNLSINTGDNLVLYATDDTIVLKTLKLPSIEEFQSAILETRNWASSVGYIENDVNNIIKTTRKKIKNR